MARVRTRLKRFAEWRGGRINAGARKMRVKAIALYPPGRRRIWRHHRASETGIRVGTCVESRMDASTDAEAPPRFPSPLIKPDVPNLGIRLSDWLHRKLTNEVRLWLG